MAAKINTTPPRGTRDVLPDEVELRDAATQRIVAVYRSYGFRRIETPALESLALLSGSDGGENEKLIFKILKRGEDLEAALRAGSRDLADFGLRFDLTVPLARYYAENHAQLPDPLKAIQIGPVWRAERPQKARFRQFTQCDIDVLGAVSPLIEIELILATCEALRAAFGLPELTVRINDRRILSRIARHCGFAEGEESGFFITFDKLDKVGFERLVAILGELGGAIGAGAPAGAQGRRIALVVDDGTDVGAALAAARGLRAAGDLVSVELRRKNVGKQLDDLARHGFDAHATLDATGTPVVKPLTRRE